MAEVEGQPSRVYLEVGQKKVFACALDWPGWCRSGKTEDAALEALAVSARRYAPVAELAGLDFPVTTGDDLELVERLPGSSSTEFGIPGAVATSDHEPVDADEARRLVALVRAAWQTFDGVSAAAPAELRKGPRGGGRDRDKMIEHVLSAEAAYARKLGVKHREPALGDREAITALRDALAEVLGRPWDGTELVAKGWPPRYGARRVAWHLLDHAWEMQDRAVAAP
jgi:hypothetical protein